MDYYLTQVSTGHGGFNTYLYRFKKSDSPECIFCQQYDDVQHAIFKCDAILPEKKSLDERLGVEITVDNMTSAMIENNDNWEEIRYVTKVLHMRRAAMMGYTFLNPSKEDGGGRDMAYTRRPPKAGSKR